MDKFLKIAVVLGAIDKASSVISNAVGKSNKELEKLGRSTRIQESLNRVGDRAIMMGAAVTGALSLTVAAAEESEVANRRLEQVFRSMGETNEVAASQAQAYASALSLQIGVEDEAILAAQAKLATFKAVSDETGRMSGIFDRATQAAFDLASAGFGEAGQNAVQLGKALQDPIKGIASLARSGVTFTAQEKAKIKALVESGRQLDAQKMILKAVEMQVGGNAKATATSSQKMKVAWGEVSETVGKILLPAVNKISDWLANVVPKVQRFIENNEGLVKGLAAVGVALLAFGVAMKVAAGVMAIFNAVMLANPIVLIIAAIAAAAAAIIMYWTEIKTFFLNLWENIKRIFLKFWNWLKQMFLDYHPYGLLIKHWDKISAWFKQIWERVKQAFVSFWNWAKQLFLDYHPYGLVIKHWDKIVAWFAGIWDKVKAIFQSWIDYVKGLGRVFYEAGANIMSSIWEGMKSMANKPIEAMEAMAEKMRSYLPFSPAKAGPLRDIHRVKIMETIAESVKPSALTNKMTSAMRQVRQSITANVNTMGGGMSPNRVASSGGGGFNYSPVVTINGGGPEAEKNFKAMLDENSRYILTMIKNDQLRAARTSF